MENLALSCPPADQPVCLECLFHSSSHQQQWALNTGSWGLEGERERGVYV